MTGLVRPWLMLSLLTALLLEVNSVANACGDGAAMVGYVSYLQDVQFREEVLIVEQGWTEDEIEKFEKLVGQEVIRSLENGLTRRNLIGEKDDEFFRLWCFSKLEVSGEQNSRIEIQLTASSDAVIYANIYVTIDGTETLPLKYFEVAQLKDPTSTRFKKIARLEEEIPNNVQTNIGELIDRFVDIVRLLPVGTSILEARDLKVAFTPRVGTGGEDIGEVIKGSWFELNATISLPIDCSLYATGFGTVDDQSGSEVEVKYAIEFRYLAMPHHVGSFPQAITLLASDEQLAELALGTDQPIYFSKRNLSVKTSPESLTFRQDYRQLLAEMTESDLITSVQNTNIFLETWCTP